jgi:hypothetical protein
MALLPHGEGEDSLSGIDPLVAIGHYASFDQVNHPGAERLRVDAQVLPARRSEQTRSGNAPTPIWRQAASGTISAIVLPMTASSGPDARTGNSSSGTLFSTIALF